ncbi:glycosyltransferase family 4 protein [uncultured Mucilaginibacter sp.]|uniref:glycosyltransferase family 4 protein n=1 Tax=uncultured Mucilaginibacter sp. TaxID=797541 RepID=UPI0025DCC712|nr:glycosyltransferase family 4 protein [uncultured Mucilaginibacter sp.]
MKRTPETLVILSPGFPENEADTACIPPQQIFARALKKICPGLNIVVISFQYPFVESVYNWHGIKVYTIGGKEKGGYNRALVWLKAWRILLKLKKETRLLGILSFWFGECAFVGSYFAKRYRLNHYTWVLGQDAKRGNKYFRWVKPKGNELIALSDFIATEIRQNYWISAQLVIPVGIDTSMFGPPPAKRDIDILGAGSLIPLKQYHIFVEAIAYLKNYFPNIKAVICGKGPEIDNLKTLVASLNLQNNLAFVGELLQKDVLALMQRSKVFLHPSAYEGFGSVLSEALYAGAHVVSFCKPMNKDYRHHYVVKTPDEMNVTLSTILKNTHRGHDPVLMCPIEQIAKNMISLFV